jgi:hypothetical protein
VTRTGRLDFGIAVASIAIVWLIALEVTSGAFGAFEVLLVAVLCAVDSGLVAQRKSRNTAGWSALGLIFGPLALVVVAVLPPRGRASLA